MVLALVSHNTLIEKIWKYVECLNGISIGISQYTHRKYGNMLNVRMVLALVSHNTYRVWKYECSNGISIGISQYTHRENMEIC